MKPKNRKQWVAAAEKAADTVSVDLDWYDETGSNVDAFHDDGNLHVLMFKRRACFTIGQDRTAADNNAITKSILELIGMPELYGYRTTLDVNEDDGHTFVMCPHCGKSF